MDAESADYNRYVEASSIKSQYEREKYLSKPFTNNLKRNLAYGNFLACVFKGKPLGKGNRVVIP